MFAKNREKANLLQWLGYGYVGLDVLVYFVLLFTGTFEYSVISPYVISAGGFFMWGLPGLILASLIAFGARKNMHYTKCVCGTITERMKIYEQAAMCNLQ